VITGVGVAVGHTTAVGVAVDVAVGATVVGVAVGVAVGGITVVGVAVGVAVGITACVSVAVAVGVHAETEVGLDVGSTIQVMLLACRANPAISTRSTTTINAPTANKRIINRDDHSGRPSYHFLRRCTSCATLSLRAGCKEEMLSP
jgi:hypothetical protein